MIEFEIKIPGNLDKVKAKLKILNAIFISSDYNYDVYYAHPQRDFKETDESLRIRTTSKETILTYKGPKFDKQSKSRMEINAIIEKEKVEQILLSLGFASYGIVNKKRETWKINDITVVLDNVENLGQYIELEIEGIEETQSVELVGILKETAIKLDLDPSKQLRISYLELLEN